MRSPFTPKAVLLGLVLTLPLSACDETTGFSGDVETAIDDAQIARESGDYETAARILEEAHQANPEDAAVRTEYATTLLEKEDLDVLDIERIATFLTDAAAAGAAARTAAGECDVPEGATVIDPTEIEELDALKQESKFDALMRSYGLLAPVIPDEFKSFDICTDIVDGAFTYDRDAVLAKLNSRYTLHVSGESYSSSRLALSSYALTQFLSAYHDAVTLPIDATWYRLPDGGIYVCASTEADRATLQAQGEAILQKIGGAVMALDARTAYGGDREILDAALDGFDAAKDGIGEYCTAQ